MWHKTASKSMYLLFKVDEAPKLIVQKKEPTKESSHKIPVKAEEVKGPSAKLPPKPQGTPNLNYKLPPKPSLGHTEPQS